MENTMSPEAMEVEPIVKNSRAKAMFKAAPSEPVVRPKRVKKLAVEIPEPARPMSRMLADPEPITPLHMINKEVDAPPNIKRIRKPKESVAIELAPVPPFPVIDLTDPEAAPAAPEVVKKAKGRPFIYKTREEYLAAKAKNFRNAYAKDPDNIQSKNALYKAEHADHIRIKQKERYDRLEEVKQFNKIVEEAALLKEEQKSKLIEELTKQCIN